MTTTRPDLERLRREFPDYDVSTLPAIPAGFLDESWHNDVCPIFRNPETDLSLMIDYPDPKDREFPEAPRFSVGRFDTDARPFNSDDFAEILRFIAEAAIAELALRDAARDQFIRRSVDQAAAGTHALRAEILLDSLADQFAAFCKAAGLPDDLDAMGLLVSDLLSDAQRRHVSEFVHLWEAAELLCDHFRALDSLDMEE